MCHAKYITCINDTVLLHNLHRSVSMVSYCHFCNLNSCDGLVNTQIGEGEERGMSMLVISMYMPWI